MVISEIVKLPSRKAGIIEDDNQILVELIEYTHDSIVKKAILKKANGAIHADSFESLEGLNASASPWDTYLRVIDGTVVIDIADKTSMLSKGDGILIPAHQLSEIKPHGSFRIILTVIKTAYE
jgi:mannose-6-phosphate isomerase-like protein (cupin superfamily)